MKIAVVDIGKNHTLVSVYSALDFFNILVDCHLIKFENSLLIYAKNNILLIDGILKDVYRVIIEDNYHTMDKALIFL